MITAFAYAVIAFHVVSMAIMLSFGVVFRGMSKNTTDYFRSGELGAVLELGLAGVARDVCNGAAQDHGGSSAFPSIRAHP